MSDRQPNGGLTRLFRESGWTLRQFAQEVNKIGTERGTPTRTFLALWVKRRLLPCRTGLRSL